LLDIIIKKRDKQKLSFEEIKFFVNGFVAGSIPDYQASAFLMAVYLNGMDDEETSWLTSAMLHSGDIIKLEGFQEKIIDKHSTGGVGDKTSLILVPLVAAAGVPVAKMSGRGLGHTGGTIDKLESIPGFKVEMSMDKFVNQVKTKGLALTGQTGNLVPADKKIYALRDVTGTISNLSLIASSIMSKKLASGSDGIVIDLKVGDGAFVKTLSEAEKLANIMINIAQKMGKPLSAVLTSMQQPLGYAIGNALEVKEALDVLKGKGPKDLVEVTLALGTEMLLLSGKYTDEEKARNYLQELIYNGEALKKCKEWIEAQGGQPEIIDNYNLLPKADYLFEYLSKDSGFISEILASHLGTASMKLGAGRTKKDDVLDMSAGIIIHKKVGDKAIKGEKLVTLYSGNESSFSLAVPCLDAAFSFSDHKPEVHPLIYKIMR
jgi:pyrimidine-nucleoside phosphorylase